MPERPGSVSPTPVHTLPAVTLARDHLPQHLAAGVRRGSLDRIGRGAYVAPKVTADARRAALARVAAVHSRLRGWHVFSHDSAALLWGLPLWRTPAVVHVYQVNHPGPRRDPRVRRHVGRLEAAAMTTVVGLPVTSLERTAVDCARAMNPLAALVVVDAALRAGAAREGLRALVEAAGRGRGTACAREVIRLGDAGAESTQESALRFVLLRAGLPQPRTQVRIPTAIGTFWADLGWEEWHVLVEYDGRPKYADPEALIREKRRHDALLEAGWRVLRVTREDMRNPAALITRVRRLLPTGTPDTRRPYLSTP